jgi:hypothetical protein
MITYLRRFLNIITLVQRFDWIKMRRTVVVYCLTGRSNQTLSGTKLSKSREKRSRRTENQSRTPLVGRASSHEAHGYTPRPYIIKGRTVRQAKVASTNAQRAYSKYLSSKEQLPSM